MDLRIFTEPQQGASYADLLAVAHATRDAGFSAFFRSDHILKMGSVTGLPGPSESFVTLAGLARDVPDIRLGTLVTSATFRYPSMLAIAAANVDEMSGGRLELGLGAGWYDAEHAAYGIPYSASVRERFDRLEEQLQIITGLWAADESGFSFDGAHYTLSDAPGLPKPAQRGYCAPAGAGTPAGANQAAGAGTPAGANQAAGTGNKAPKVPIIVGGHGPKRTPALAARFADEFNIAFSGLDTTTAQFARVRTACETADRDPATLVYSAAQVLCLGRNEEEFTRRAAAIGRGPAELRENGMAGTITEVVDKLGRWQEAGVERLYLQVLDLADLDHVALAGEALH